MQDKLESLKNITECVVYCDGACSNNPGVGGWATVIKDTISGEEFEFFGGELNTTNNRMELSGAIESLKILPRNIKIVIYTDSKYLQDGITVWIKKWEKNGWLNSLKQPVKNQDLWQTLSALCLEFSNLNWEWVKAHSKNPLNDRADCLAKGAIISQKMLNPF